MSLLVHARQRGLKGSSDDWTFIPPAPPYGEFAGFESWRTTVWGSAQAKRLGLRLLPMLADRDLYVSGPELEQLETELATLQIALEDFVDKLRQAGVHVVASPADSLDTVRVRLANIAEAIRVARALPANEGQVVIW